MRKLYNSISNLLSLQHLRNKAVGEHRTKRLLTILAIFCSIQTVFGQTNNYFGTAGTISGSVWSTSVGGPYTSALVTTGGPILNFNNAGTATGATIATTVGMNFNAAITWTAGGTFGAAGINLPINVASGININFTPGLSAAATAAFTKNGLGGFQTAGAAFGGGLTINAGTWIAGGTNALGGNATPGPLVINGGAISASNATARTFAGKLSGITVGGNFSLGNVTDFAAGTGNLTFDAPVALGSSVTRTINIGNTGSYALNGIISGASSNLIVASTAAGTLVLGGANSYTGTTTVNGGTLSVTGSLPNTTDVTLANTAGAVLSIGATQTIASIAGGGTTGGNLTLSTGTLSVSKATGTTTFSGLISGTGSLTKAGASVQVLGHTANTYSGTTTITAGELRLNPSTTTGTFASPVVLNGGKLSTTGIAASSNFTSSSTLGMTASSTLDLGTNAHSLIFANSSAVTWTGATALVINGWTGTAGGSGTAGKLFVGNTSAGLTSGQLAQISFNGFTGTATILSTGEIVPPAVGSPSFSFSPASFSGMTANFGANGTAVSTTISGSFLSPVSGDITVNAPANFEVSKDNITFGSSATFAYTGSNTFNASNNTVYFRITNAAACGVVSGSATTSGGTMASPPNISLAGTVINCPTLAATPASLTGFTNVEGTASTAQNFSLSATNLSPASGNITVTAPTNFEVFDGASWVSSYTVAYTGSALGATTVQVRVAASALAGAVSGNVSFAGGGATTITRAVSGTVSANPYLLIPAINSAVTSNFNTIGNTGTATLTAGLKLGTDWSTGTTATTLAYGTSGTGAATGTSSGGVINWADGVTASSTDRAVGFLTTSSFTTPTSMILAIQNNTGATATDLYVTYDIEKYRTGTRAWDVTFFHGSTTTPTTSASAGDQNYPADVANAVVNPPTTISKSVLISGLTIPAGGIYYLKWTYTGSGGTTNAQGLGFDNISVILSNATAPTVTVTPTTLTGFTYTLGSGPSTPPQTFTVSGSNLTNNVVIAPPTDYEVSLSSGSGYVANPSSLTVTQSGGSLTGQPVTIYTRLKAGLATASYNNEVINITSTGAIPKTVTASGLVAPAVVTLSASAATGTEQAGTMVTITATTNNAVLTDQTVDVVVTGTGITGTDYSITDGDAAAGIQIKILAGNTTGSITFTILDDNLLEVTETATLTISNPTSGMGLGSPTVVNIAITDNDDAIYLSALNVAEPTITFDDLANSGTNSLTIKGTYLYETTGNATYGADFGNSNVGNTYSYGASASTDRALGSLCSNGNNPIHVGLKLNNNTGTNMNAFEITYTGEQWRNGGNTSADILYFEYSTDATSLSTGTWNKINALNMVSLINTATAATLDGNLSANRTTLNGVVGLGTITNGTSFWIRWRDENIGGNDHGMGLDDLILKPLFITPSIFYSKSTGDLDQATSWGDNTDGSGNAPSNFTTAGQIFYIANHKATAATIGANWTVSGSTAKVSIGNGLDTNSFVVPAGFTFSSPTLDVRSNNVFTNESATTAAVFGIIDATSTVTYGAISGTQNVDATTYGFLNFVGAGTKNISGALTVQKDLTLDGVTMDKLFAGFVNITYAGNISILSPCTYLTGFTTNVSFVTTGNAAQVVKGNGNALGCSQFNCLTKTSGSLTLSTTGGSTTINAQDDIKLNMPTGTSFVDGGNILNVGGDFETDGLAASYTLTGTLSMNGFPSAAVNVRLNATGGAALPGVAELNNVIINSATSNQVNFQPIGAGSGSTLIKGNLTISGTSGYATGIRFGNAAATGVTLHGNYNNNLSISAIFPTAGTLIFGGTSAQTYSTAYSGGDSFFNVVLNNTNGLTLSTGDMQANGNLNCSSGILTTGANKVIMGSTATITETTTSNVIGFVQSTRTLTTALQTFGGLGLEISSAVTAPGVTTVSRETGTSLPIGCSSTSNKRIFSVTAATNTGLSATVAYKYLGSVAELNGLNENNFNLFDQTGSLISSNAVLNTGTKTITAIGLTSLTSYVAAIPSPTLGGVTLGQTYTCDDSTNVVNLSGLLQSGTFNVSYSINGVPQTGISGLVANGSGNASFTTPTLFNGNNGQLLEITAISQPSTGCSQSFASGNSATLDVRPRPTVVISANDFVCQFQNAPIDFSFTGNANWVCDYKINGVVQTQINTSLALFPNDYINASVARTYAITRLRDANCPANLAGLDTFFINVPIPCSITWDGSASSDWNDGDNWTPNNGAPSNQTSVVINGGTPNQPVLNNNTPASPVCASLTLVSNATPTISPGFLLTVRGNLTGTNSPSLGGSGKVILAGTGLQTISGTVRLTNVDFANTSASGVVINSGSTLRIEPSGVVSFLANSKLTNNGDFVLGSNAAGTAKIGLIPTTANILPVGAQFTQERYLPYTTGSGSWFFIGSPFSGKNFTDWVDDFRVTGLSSGFGSQGGDIISSIEPERNTIFKFVEATHDTRIDTVQKIGWTIPGAAEQIVTGNGYRTFINYASNASHLFDSKGTLNRNDFTFPTLTRNELGACIPTSFPCNETSNRGWNLLANPYPCDVDWDATTGWTKPGTMSNAWYRWNSTGNGYGVYTTGIYAGATPAPSNPNVIPSGQGYFVRLTGAGTYNATLIVKELAKTTSTSGQFMRVNTNTDQIRVHMTKPNSTDNYGYDAVIRFIESATDGVDHNFDFANLGGPKFQITIPVMGEELAIASYAPVSDFKSIPLATDYKGATGEFTLSFADMESLMGTNQLFLKDNYLDQLHSINIGSTYSYLVSNDGSASRDRFEILINPNVLTSVNSFLSGTQVRIYPNPSAAGTSALLSIRGFDDSSVTISITDALGRNVYTTNAALTSLNGTDVKLSKSLPAGVYTVITRGSHKSVTQKFVVK